MSNINHRLVTRAADITAAYVSHNHVAASDLPKLLTAVHRALCGLGRASAIPPEAASVGPAAEAPTPAQIRKSIRDEGLTSFLNGKPYKTLRRHLTAHGLTPDSYRMRYGLPADYPMTALGYAAQRSALAKAIGLGVPGAQAARTAAE